MASHLLDELMQNPQTVKEVLNDFCAPLTDQLICPKAIDLIPSKPKLAISGDHLRVKRQRGAPIAAEMMRSVHFDHNSLVVG